MVRFRRYLRRKQARRRPWKLRTRLALALLIVVAPIAVLLVASHVENLQDQRQAQVQSYQAIGDSLRSSIDGFTRDLEALSFAASIALSNSGAPTQVTAGGYLAELRESYGDLRGIFVTDLEGRVTASDDGINLGLDLSQRDYFIDMQAGAETIWTGAVVGSQTGQTVILHGRVIRNLAGEPTAFLYFSFTPENLASRLPDLSPDSTVSLLDARGSVLYTTSEAPLSRDAIASSAVFQGARDGSRVLIEGDVSPTDEGKRYGAFLNVPGAGWVVGFTRPAASIDGDFQNRLRRDVAVMTLLIIGGVALMFGIASRLSKPLSRLSSTADAIARGEQPDVPIDMRDADVLKLSRALHTMTRAISDREDRLLAQTRIMETLERVGETLATELDYADAVSSIVVAAQQLTRAQAVGIYYTDHENDGEVRLLGIAGEKKFPLANDDPVVVRTLEGEVLDVPELGVFPGANPPPQLASGGIVHSFLGVPIISRYGDVHGGLFLLHDKYGAFTERHRLLASGLARRASIVVENARLYSQARQQQERLHQASMQKSEFIGLISHELRTPITTVLGGARLLNSERRHRLTEEQREELIDSIEEESERLHRLVEDLLMLAKTDLYEDVEIDILSAGPLVERAVRQFTSRNPDRPVDVILSDDVPLLLGEPSYLHQVLTNLISNADKYSDKGLPIEIEVCGRGDNVLFRVMDRGPGVKPEELDQLFESFFRSKHTEGRAQGKGLGLTVCKRLIEAMSGKIWIANREGGGLEASFSLPAAIVDVPEEDLETDNKKPEPAAAPVSNGDRGRTRAKSS